MINATPPEIEPLHQYDEDILNDEIQEHQDNGFKDDLECNEKYSGKDDDNDLYDLSNYSFDRHMAAKQKTTDHSAKRPEPHTAEYYLDKASQAYDKFKYEKCLDYIRDYEVRVSKPPYERTITEKVIVLAYTAYCKKALKKYSAAKDYFREMISLMKKSAFSPECLFTTHFQHACCYAHLGNMEECKERIRKLVNMDFGLNIDYLAKNDYMIHHQPCFHNHKLSNFDKLVINEIVATALGKEILELQREGKLIPTNCLCSYTNESKEFCSALCGRVGGYAAAIIALIPDRATQILALFALAEFNVECPKCCEEGLGSENCCKGLKSILAKFIQASVIVKI